MTASPKSKIKSLPRRATPAEIHATLRESNKSATAVLHQILSKKLDDGEAKSANNAMKTLMNGSIALANTQKNDAMLDKTHLRIAILEREIADDAPGTVTETVLAVRKSLQTEDPSHIKRMIA